MFDWLFEKRIRVRVKFVTCWCNYYREEVDVRWRILGALASYEGTSEDQKLYLRMRRVTPEFYNDCGFTNGGHKEPDKELKFDEIEEDAFIEFNCWESTLKKLTKSLDWWCHDFQVIGEVL